MSTLSYRIWHAESSGVIGFLLSRQDVEKIGLQDFIRKTSIFSLGIHCQCTYNLI